MRLEELKADPFLSYAWRATDASLSKRVELRWWPDGIFTIIYPKLAERRATSDEARRYGDSFTDWEAVR